MVRTRRSASCVGDEIIAEERPRWGIADGGQIDDRGRRGARSLSAFEFCGIHRRQIVHFFALSPNRYRRVSHKKHLSPPIPQFFCARSGGMGGMRGLLTIPWKLSTLFFNPNAMGYPDGRNRSRRYVLIDSRRDDIPTGEIAAREAMKR